MHAFSPPESIHALTTDELAHASITLWCAWEGEHLLGCAALKHLDATQGEIKSMRTTKAHRRQGVAEALLVHLIKEAMDRGYERLSLETGSHEAFLPAQRLYQKHGFEFCAPFGEYKRDPYSVFMSRAL